MPQPFIALNPGNTQYYLNAYAYMWELNAFRLAYQNGQKDIFGEFSAIPHRIGWSDDPFQMFKYIIPVDVESDHRHKIEVNELYPTVAEMVYFLNMGNVKNSTISNMSNDNRLINTTLTRHSDTRCLWSTPLIAYGYRAVKKANQELLKYLKTRGMYEIVRYGLLGNDITEEDLLLCGKRMELSREYCRDVIEKTKQVVSKWMLYAEKCRITEERADAIATGIEIGGLVKIKR
jgi:hypothetical protein